MIKRRCARVNKRRCARANDKCVMPRHLVSVKKWLPGRTHYELPGVETIPSCLLPSTPAR
jgi:hypothetical protein